jgi:fido (protein-threonine AMPylation protein)
MQLKVRSSVAVVPLTEVQLNFIHLQIFVELFEEWAGELVS